MKSKCLCTLINQYLKLIALVAINFSLGLAHSQTIKIVQTLGLTGPVADYAQEKKVGSKIYFDAINAAGGINGRKIELVWKDDGYKGDTAAQHYQEALSDPTTLAMLGPLGVPVVSSLLKASTGKNLPIVGMSSGSDTDRTRVTKSVFPVRATYGAEAQATIKLLKTIGVKSFNIVYQDDSFGKSIRDSYLQALKDHQLKSSLEVPLARDGELTTIDLEKISNEKSTVILLALTTKSAATSLRQLRQTGNFSQAYGMSVLAANALIQQAGQSAVGTVVSQIVPPLRANSLPLVRTFIKACEESKVKPSEYAFEAYIEARVLHEGMKRAFARSKNPSREDLIASLESLGSIDLGGMRIKYSSSGHMGSDFVDLTIVNSRGQLTN
jgi:branched-chain amino acid transport system substrate-binding protein